MANIGFNGISCLKIIDKPNDQIYSRAFFPTQGKNF
jgi:hypothetical protein